MALEVEFSQITHGYFELVCSELHSPEAGSEGESVVYDRRHSTTGLGFCCRSGIGLCMSQISLNQAVGSVVFMAEVSASCVMHSASESLALLLGVKGFSVNQIR